MTEQQPHVKVGDLLQFMAFQHEVGAWGQRTFQASTPISVAHHLVDEAGEVGMAAVEFVHDGNQEGIREEAADCLLMLLHLAHKCGFNLLEEATKKYAVNQTRTWGVPDTRGVVRHIDAETEEVPA